MTTAAPLDRQTGNSIATTRLFLALLVLFSHSFPLGQGTERFEPLALLTQGHLTLGMVAVDFFFVLSGYLITKSWAGLGRPRTFLWHRVRRIYPGFLVAVVLVQFVLLPVLGQAVHPASTWQEFAATFGRLAVLQTSDHFQGFPNNPTPGAANGSLWSIPFEFWCYIGVLAFGLTKILSRRWVVVAVWVAAIVVDGVMAVTGWNPGGGILGTIFGWPLLWARMAPCFLAGMVAYLFRDRWTWQWWFIPLGLVGMVATAWVPGGVVVGIPTFGLLLLLGLAFAPSSPLEALCRRTDLSYGVYLYAFPIQQTVVYLAGRAMGAAELFAIALPITLAAGALSWFLVERHFVASKAPGPVSS